MLKKIFILLMLLLVTISSTANAEGIVPVICPMEEYNYCKDIKKIIEYTPKDYRNHKATKIYTYANNRIIEYTPEGYRNYEPTKIYTDANNRIIEYTPEGYRNYEPIKIYALIKY